MSVTLFFSKSSSFYSKLIRFLTWSNYSHVGFVLEDGFILDSDFMSNGVKVRTFEELKITEYEIYTKECPTVSRTALDFACSQVDKPYDWTALFGFFIRRNWQENDSWFCSELVAWACDKAGTPLVDKELWRVTPQDIYQSVITPKK